MHEEALFRDLRRKLEELGREHRGERITRVRIWVGALSHVSAPMIQDRWPGIVADTPARSACLEVEVSTDPHDPRAEGIVLADIDLVEASAAPSLPPPHQGGRP